MSTMNISLPDSLKRFIDEQVTERGFGSSSEYVRDLVRKQRDIEQLRQLLLDGVRSGPGVEVDDAWFAQLRERSKGRTAA